MSFQRKYAGGFVFVIVALVAGMLSGCHNWMYSVGKGRPPNPEPDRTPPESAEVIEWIHPLACRIQFRRGGRDVLGTLLILDDVQLEQSPAGEAILPGWMWQGGSEVLRPESVVNSHYIEAFPVGSIIQIEYPLKGKTTYPSSAGEGMPASSGGFRIYNGYFGTPKSTKE